MSVYITVGVLIAIPFAVWFYAEPHTKELPAVLGVFAVLLGLGVSYMIRSSLAEQRLIDARQSACVGRVVCVQVDPTRWVETRGDRTHLDARICGCGP